MTRNRKQKIKPFPSYDKIQQIDPDEFITTFIWAMNAARGEAHLDSPTKQKLNIREDGGNISQIVFTDHPTNRVIFAIKERYRGDTDKFFSVATRIFAIGNILRDPSMSKWVKSTGENVELHTAVVAAAATVPINSEGEFNLDEFKSKVEELATTKYKDEEF